MLNAMLIYSWAIYAFALRLAADHRSGRHRRVVQQVFRGRGVAAPVFFRFSVHLAAQRDFDIHLNHKGFSFSARG